MKVKKECEHLYSNYIGIVDGEQIPILVFICIECGRYYYRVIKPLYYGTEKNV